MIAAAVPPDSDWFPVRITSIPTAGLYVFQEVWLGPDGLIADRVGGRVNTANDPAIAIDRTAFTVSAAGSPVQCLARRAVGAGGLLWELKPAASRPSLNTNQFSHHTGETGWVPAVSPSVFTQMEADSGRFVYHANGQFSGIGTFALRYGLGVWPAAYSHPDLAAAAAKLKVIGITYYAASGSGATSGVLVVAALGLTDGMGWATGDFPLNLGPIGIVDSGTVTNLLTNIYFRV